MLLLFPHAVVLALGPCSRGLWGVCGSRPRGCLPWDSLGPIAHSFCGVCKSQPQRCHHSSLSDKVSVLFLLDFMNSVVGSLSLWLMCPKR